jgi:hypothetical protein
MSPDTPFYSVTNYFAGGTKVHYVEDHRIPVLYPSSSIQKNETFRKYPLPSSGETVGMHPTGAPFT